MLRAIFELQSALNDHVFASNGLQNDEAQGLRMAHIAVAAERGKCMVNEVPSGCNGMPRRWKKNSSS